MRGCLLLQARTDIGAETVSMLTCRQYLHSRVGIARGREARVRGGEEEESEAVGERPQSVSKGENASEKRSPGEGAGVHAGREPHT
jgi:hypothetical protein